MPALRARRCTSSLATSARCGWFSGISVIIWTVPTMPSLSSATTSVRSPRAMPSLTVCQKRAAVSRAIGSMKLTEAPPSTQSEQDVDQLPAQCGGFVGVECADYVIVLHAFLFGELCGNVTGATGWRVATAPGL